ncbi:hypothetical protein BC939DRAFT_481485 [Gamsiella multidivaricata]|uniref:uncharacterized protein n=1 Tax=Gamsiella multidivaricata TaxID=101098 RepID=UPI00222020D5|nr:uncharacterized protein BC939DRAFT_481485 [Gamsiella multidivaricata]KAI7817044.1 hypothetical protein BC939DRAFT_481485 [Gamsiella multidivaricata]
MVIITTSTTANMATITIMESTASMATIPNTVITALVITATNIVAVVMVMITSTTIRTGMTPTTAPSPDLTIGAVYRSNGTMARSGGQLDFFLQLCALNNNNNPKPSKPKPPTNNTSSRSLAFLDIVSMDPLCPKPSKKNIDHILKQIT